MAIELEWTQFKNFVDNRSASIEYSTTKNFYHLLAAESDFEVTTTIVKLDIAPDPSDQKDFEDNYKADANKPLVLITRVDEATGLITYRGKAKIGTLVTDSKWQILRDVKTGNETITDTIDGGALTQKWSDRATLFPNAPYIPSKSLQFDGANDFVTIPHHADLDRSRLEAFSMSMWIKTSITNNRTFLEKMDGGNIGYRYFLASQKPKFDFHGTGGTGDRIQVKTENQESSLLDGSWHSLIYTYDGSGNADGVKIYIDSVSKAMDTTPDNDNLSTDPLNTANIGYGARSNGGDNFDGNIYSPVLWSRELTQTDIDEIYNSGNPININNHTNSVDVEMWHPMNNITFPTVPDGAGTHNGTMTNMVVGDIEGTVPGNP